MRVSALAASVAVAFLGRFCRSRSRQGPKACLAAVAAREAPPRPPKEEPTPFPRSPIFPPEAFRLLELFNQDKPDLQELVMALEDFQYLHSTDRQWGRFPRHVADVPAKPYNRGMFQIVRGIFKCIQQQRSSDLRFLAVDTLLALVMGGTNITRCSVNFVVEAGGVGVLCGAAKESGDSSVLEILLEIARMAPDEMLPPLIEKGAVEACIEIIEDSGATPLDQLAALDLILALSKRAPAPVANAGAFDAVKNITNVVLIPRRNKIMNFLRPLVQHEGEEEDAPRTNLRIGGLKF